MTGTVDSIPKQLKERSAWVVWRHERKPDGKTTKVPCDPLTGGHVDATVPSNGKVFTEAAAHLSSFAGLGIALGEDSSNAQGDNLAGIDLDDCGDEAIGGLELWAQGIVAHFDSYTEWGPSGTGVKILVFGTLPEGSRSRVSDWNKIVHAVRTFGGCLRRPATEMSRSTPGSGSLRSPGVTCRGAPQR